MTDQDYSHIAMIVDRSGSMETIRVEIEGAVNAFVAEQKKQPGRATMTLAKFDNEYDVVADCVDIAAVGPLDLQPRGMTALLDSVARIITDTGASLSAMDEDSRPGTVIVAIVTDGHENASREMDHKSLKAMIEKQESKFNWEFIYLGANQDAVEVGASMGIRADRSLTYANAAAAGAVGTTSGLVSSLRGASVESRSTMGYSAKDRAAVQ